MKRKKRLRLPATSRSFPFTIKVPAPPGSMANRVAAAMVHAATAGMLVKCRECRAFHFGGTTKEIFDVERVMPGEQPVLLPHGAGGATERLTLHDVKRIIRSWLEETDARSR